MFTHSLKDEYSDYCGGFTFSVTDSTGSLSTDQTTLYLNIPSGLSPGSYTGYLNIYLTGYPAAIHSEPVPFTVTTCNIHSFYPTVFESFSASRNNIYASTSYVLGEPSLRTFAFNDFLRYTGSSGCEYAYI